MGAVAAKITLVQNGRFSNNGKAIWDNVQFYPLQKSNFPTQTADNSDLPSLALRVNLIENSGFQSNTEGWRVSAGGGTQGEWSRAAGFGALKTKEPLIKSIMCQRDLKRAVARQLLKVMAVALSEKVNAANVGFRARPAGPSS